MKCNTLELDLIPNQCDAKCFCHMIAGADASPYYSRTTLRTVHKSGGPDRGPMISFGDSIRIVYISTVTIVRSSAIRSNEMQ